MILIFVLLELLANWAYQWNFGTVTEILLHISLSCALFGLVTLLTGQKVRLAFALNTLLLFIFLIAYLISYQTEEALGVPLHLREAIENLQDDPSLLMFLKDFIYAAKGMILIGLIGIIVSLSILY